MDNMLPLLRRKRMITQRDLARMLDVSPSYLCKVEKGMIEPAETFRNSCADFFNDTVENIFVVKPVMHMEHQGEARFHNNLWSARIKKNIKQNQLAGQLGCSPSYLSRIEKGLQLPSIKFRRQCAKILKISESELFPGSIRDNA